MSKIILVTFIFITFTQGIVFVSADKKVEVTKAFQAPLDNVPPEISTTCGGILRTQKGGIEYKTLDLVKPNERCVWILRHPNVTRYYITVKSLDIPSSVILSGFGYKALRFVSNHTVPEEPTLVTMDNNNIVVVTFYTAPYNMNGTTSRGFSLNYEAITTTYDLANDLADDVLIQAGSGLIKFPANRTAPGNSEISTFVVTPAKNALDGFRRNELIYINSGQLVEYDYYNLHVYTFELGINNANKWNNIGSINRNAESHLISSKDLLMIVYADVVPEPPSKFHLYSTSSDCGE